MAGMARLSKYSAPMRRLAVLLHISSQFLGSDTLYQTSDAPSLERRGELSTI